MSVHGRFPKRRPHMHRHSSRLHVAYHDAACPSRIACASGTRHSGTQAHASSWSPSIQTPPPHQQEQTLKQAYFWGCPKSAVRTQVSIDSQNSAIHNAYRSSLRPSSLLKPRHPSLNVVVKSGSHSCAKSTSKKGRSDKHLAKRLGRRRTEHPTTPQRPRGPAQEARKLHPQTELRAGG